MSAATSAGVTPTLAAQDLVRACLVWRTSGSPSRSSTSADSPAHRFPTPTAGMPPKVALHTVVLDDDPHCPDQPDRIGRWAGRRSHGGRTRPGTAGGTPDESRDADPRRPHVTCRRRISPKEHLRVQGLRTRPHRPWTHPRRPPRPVKARILLQCLLTSDAGRDQIHTAFAVAGQYSDPDHWPWPYPQEE